MLSKLKLSILIGSFLILAALPMVAESEMIDEPFYIDLMARVMIFSIAAMSLDFILGYGAMISFGHALYLGLGTYAVGIMAHYELTNGWMQLLVCISGTAFIAFILGLISLRTSGIYFIMITFALAQMFYFLGISLEAFGGDDGLPIDTRSEFFSFFDLNETWNMYYLILGTLVVTALVLWKIINSRFGMVVRGSHSNDARMQAIGFPTFKYRLAAFVIAGVVCGLAGFLLGNLTEFLTPEYMHWFRSGELMIMVMVGGMGTLFGPLFGAFAYLMMEDFLANFTEYWQFYFGPILILLVLFAKQGLWGMLPGKEDISDE
ncbi:MAG: branched-chain amino acid ABC transporter permease [Alphaproteobacteria bacterium]|jgi:branched-chain amino acid transport system permease protein|nr:branched-chain amino acid ABC transporter permease [Alphaproteobacteria bacterium]|tara:strand:- start:159 stop:1115 length:957 start_codon:yes stop_codon:yes gene_type:complete